MVLGYILVIIGVVLGNAAYFEDPYLYNPRSMEIQQLDPVIRLFWERNIIGVFLFTLALISLFAIYAVTYSNNRIISKNVDRILHIFTFIVLLVGIASFTIFYDFNVNGYNLVFMGSDYPTYPGMLFIFIAGIANIYYTA